jgi:shikimate kinase
MKTLYLIGGTMGVGKTTVCQMLKQDLPNSVFLDGDWCWDADPFQVTEETKTLVQDNICHMLNNFLQCSVYETVIFCWVMHEQEIIDSIIAKLKLDNCEVKCISLIADEDNLQRRLTRDVQKGIRKEDVIDRSIARIPLYQKLDTVKVDTNNKTIAEIVAEIAQL